MSKNRPLDFTSSAERSQWIIDNADYFVVYVRLSRTNKIRNEYQTLEKAEQAAQKMLSSNPDWRIMIYAVHDVIDTWVKTIQSSPGGAGQGVASQR